MNRRNAAHRTARRAARLLTGASLAGFLTLAGNPAAAQNAGVQTAIIADKTGANGAGTLVDGRGESITIGGGQVAGDNLFHSFATFDLAAGATARWSAPGSGSIANIINRVTGGAASHIDGAIDTTAMPGAAFYFINPNGVLFGAGATLNVPGAAYFSTATDLRFANGDVFSAKTANGSTLSMSTPASFGFVGGEQNIMVLGMGSDPYARLASGEIPTPKLVLVAPNIGIGNAGLLVGEVELAAAGSVRDISISTPLANPTNGELLIVNSNIVVSHDPARAPATNGFSQIGGGAIALIDSNIESIANPGAQGGGIALQGATLDLQNSGLITTTVNSGTAGGLLVSLSDSLTMDGTSGVVSTTNGPGRGGDILIVGSNDLTITGGNIHTMSANSADGLQGAGEGGAITIAVAGDLTLDKTTLTGFSTGSGAGGAIRVSTSGDLTTIGVDASTSTLSTGAGGSLLLEAGGDMNLATTRIFVTSVSEEAQGGDAGLLALTAQGALSIDDSLLTTMSSGEGAAGNIRLQSGGDLSLLSAIITADSYGSGAGGVIYATSGADMLARLSVFSNDAYATGNGGSLTLEAIGALTVDQSHFLASSNSEGAGGAGGLIRLAGGAGVAVADTELITVTKGGGVGGDVLVTSDGDITLTRTVIRGESQNTGEGGDGGNVKIEAQGAVGLIDPVFTTNTYGLGNAGGMLISAGGDLRVTGGLISSASLSTGAGGGGGLVSLASTGSLALNGVQINTSTFGSGNGGYVSIESGADASLLDTEVWADTGLGGGDGGYVFVLSKGLLTMTTSNIYADTYGPGIGGNVLVNSDAALVVNDSKISADTLGPIGGGAGGQVNVASGEKMTLNAARIYADTYGSGQGGDVIVASGGDMTIDGGYISAESRGVAGLAGVSAQRAAAAAPLAGGIDGDGGSVTIASQASMLVTGGAQLSTDTLGSGDSGVLAITAENTLTMNGASQAYANTNGSGTGGVVVLRAADLMLTDATVSARTNGSGSSFGVALAVGKATIGAGALVTSAGTASGDAGRVRVTDMEGEAAAQSVAVVDGGSVTASATGTGQAGSIEILSDRVAMLSGGEVVTSSSNAHAAGSILIDTHTLVVDGAGGAGGASQIISQNDYAERTPLGDNLGGDITITAHDVTIANGGQLNTNSVTGDAGVIALDLGRDGPGLLWLKGQSGQGGVIRTDSGTGSGGQISIDNVYAIVSNGSEISASGDVSNAFVTIDARAVRVNSTDRANVVNVSGLVSIAPDQDVSSGTTIVEVPFIDASQVLEGRCRAVRSQGRGSRIDMEDLGPYAQSPRAGSQRRASLGSGKPGCL